MCPAANRPVLAVCRKVLATTAAADTVGGCARLPQSQDPYSPLGCTCGWWCAGRGVDAHRGAGAGLSVSVSKCKYVLGGDGLLVSRSRTGPAVKRRHAGCMMIMQGGERALQMITHEQYHRHLSFSLPLGRGDPIGWMQCRPLQCSTRPQMVGKCVQADSQIGPPSRWLGFAPAWQHSGARLCLCLSPGAAAWCCCRRGACWCLTCC